MYALFGFLGLFVMFFGLINVIYPIRALRVTSRKMATIIIGVGVVSFIYGLVTTPNPALTNQNAENTQITEGTSTISEIQQQSTANPSKEPSLTTLQVAEQSTNSPAVPIDKPIQDEQEKPVATQKEDVSSKSSNKTFDKIYSIGDRIELGQFAYSVKKVTVSKSLGNQFYNTKAGEGAKFLIIYFTIENLDKETATVLTDDFNVIDNQGRKFRPSSAANTTLMMTSEGKDFLISEIHPGIKKDMKTAFELPEASIKEGLRLIIPEKGFFGTGKAEIALKFK